MNNSVKIIRKNSSDKFWMDSANIAEFRPVINIDEFTSIGLGVNKTYPTLTSIVKKTVGKFMDTEKYRINKKTGKAIKVVIRTEVGVFGDVIYTSTNADCLRKIQLDFSPFGGITIGDIVGVRNMSDLYKKYGIDSQSVENFGSKIRTSDGTTGYQLVRHSKNKEFYMLLVVTEKDVPLFSDYDGNRFSVKCIYKGTKRMCLRKLGVNI